MSTPDTIPHFAERAARCWPDTTALAEGGHRWTFAELWNDARKTASMLLASGIQKGDAVAVWAPNSREWVLAALGAQIIGGILIPLNTRLKGREAGDILRRSRAKALFTVGEFLGNRYLDMLEPEDLPLLQQRLLLDDWPALTQTADAQDPRVDAALAALKPDDISDIIFTSGTTGKPKGVISAHGQVIHSASGWIPGVDLREGDHYLIVNPFFHTFGYKVGWVACLMRGAVMFPMSSFDVDAIVHQIEHHRINFLPGPPLIFQTLIARRAERAHDFSSLRVAVTGSAPVPPALVHQMWKDLGLKRVINGYGMTECLVISMIRADDDAETIANTVGVAMPGIEIRCVDDTGRDVPADTVGEILVRGKAVMRGYLDNPEATAEAIDREGWLHTGDLGTLDARGYLRITDRKKDMYISGGFNCYPAEIEQNTSCAHTPKSRRRRWSGFRMRAWAKSARRTLSCVPASRPMLMKSPPGRARTWPTTKSRGWSNSARTCPETLRARCLKRYCDRRETGGRQRLRLDKLYTCKTACVSTPYAFLVIPKD